MLANLGYLGDKRLRPALKILKDKRQGNAAWLLDRVRTDSGQGINEGVLVIDERIKPFGLEGTGEPRRWITLVALRE